MNYFGYNPPWVGGQQNVLSRQAGDRLIKNDLLQLIRTGKGERVMRPSWGTVLNATVFEQLDESTSLLLADDIASQVNSYEPRVRVNVRVTKDEDKNQLSVLVHGYYTNEPNRTFEIEVNIPHNSDV